MKAYRDFECMYCNKKNSVLEGEIKYCPFCGMELNNKEDVKSISLDDDIEEAVYAWLAKTLEIDSWLVSETIKNQVATVFLLIWPIIETKVFDRGMKPYLIEEMSKKIENDIPEKELDLIASHFYERYQDSSKYRKLISSKSREWNKIPKILRTPFNRLYKNEKIFFMIFVVYRYRNNIFHGRKSIKEWNEYLDEIQQCIKFMILLGNCI